MVCVSVVGYVQIKSQIIVKGREIKMQCSGEESAHGLGKQAFIGACAPGPRCTAISDQLHCSAPQSYRKETDT